MDALYPTSQEPHLPPQSVMLDTSGFMDLVSTTYRTLLTHDDKLERYMSEPEFMLCNAQILARHVLWIRTHALNVVIPGQKDLFDSIGEETTVAAPIAQYLDGLGVVRHVTGEILVPNLVLPRMDIGVNNHLAGMGPSIYGDSYTTNTHWQLLSSMMQFGMLKRAIDNAHHGRNYHANNALDRLDPANAAAEDVHWARPSCLPKYTQLIPMHRDRVGKLLSPFMSRAGSLLEASLCWNGQLFQQYVLFMKRAESHIACSVMPRTTAGTAAYLAWATPESGGDVEEPNSFFYFSNCKLTGPEQHAARLFRYRQVRSRDANCAEPGPGFADREAVYRASPASLQGATMTMTAVSSYNAYLGHFIRYFCRR